MRTDYAKVFRKLLNGPDIIVLPGSYDALSARIAEQAGFNAVQVAGGPLSASLGYTDSGLLTMSEVLARARYIINSVKIPVIVDCNDGYGTDLNLARTVVEFEEAGAAGIHIEDIAPNNKGDGHTRPPVIDREDMVRKIRIATAARQSKDFVIIARTDALAQHGLEEALARCKAYAEAGADAIWPNFFGAEQIRMVAKAIDTPLWKGSNPPMTVREAQDAGIKMVLFGQLMCSAAIKAMQGVMKELKETGTSKGFTDRMATRADRDALMGQAALRYQELLVR